MRDRFPLGLILAVCPVIFVACYADRPVLLVGGSAGAAGTVNAGTTGAAGTSGSAGTSGGAGAGVVGCDISKLIVPGKYWCTQPGACHDGSASTAGGLDMVTPGWEKHLVGLYPTGKNASMCGSVRIPYLVPGSQPARGLLLQKMTDPPPCGQLMPTLGGPMSPQDYDCFQQWANAVTASVAATGAAGTSGSAGTSGAAGTGGLEPGCDITPLIGSPSTGPGKYYCTLAGACHDSTPTAAGGLDMVSNGWQISLLGRYSGGYNSSMCGGQNSPYLIVGTHPARGLFLDKLMNPSPCGALMPTLGGPMTAQDLDCFQRWADQLTSIGAP